MWVAALYLTMFIWVGVILKMGCRKNVFTIKFGLIDLSDKILFKALWIAIALFPIIFFLTNRVDVGSDYNNYMIYYERYVNWGYVGTMEVGVLVLYSLAAYLGMGYQGFLFLAAILSLFVSTMAIRTQVKKEFYPFAIVIFLCLYFGPTCNIMAQMMALSFLIFAYAQMYKKHAVKYIAFCLIAALFHTAALICIPIFFIYHFNGKRYVRVIAVGVLFFSVLMTSMPGLLQNFLITFGFGRYTQYFELEKTNTFIYLLIYRLPLYALEGVYYVSKIKVHKAKTEIDDECRMYYFLIICEIASCILGIGVAWAGRLAYFFSVSHVLVSTHMLDKNHTYNRFVIKYGILLYFIIYFVMVHFYSEFDVINKFTLS